MPRPVPQTMPSTRDRQRPADVDSLQRGPVADIPMPDRHLARSHRWMQRRRSWQCSQLPNRVMPPGQFLAGDRPARQRSAAAIGQRRCVMFTTCSNRGLPRFAVCHGDGACAWGRTCKRVRLRARSSWPCLRGTTGPYPAGAECSMVDLPTTNAPGAPRRRHGACSTVLPAA